MTEEEWLLALTPTQMLVHVENLRPRPTPRKQRLLACACCRAVWSDSWPSSCRNVVVAAEEFADKLISEKHLNEARSRACQAAQSVAVNLHRARRHSYQSHLEHSRITFAANTASGDVHFGDYAEPSSMYHALINSLSPDKILVHALPWLMRDVLGNPFRPVTLDPRWQSETVVALANSIYAERAFDRMPILADALEEAGCDHADILSHCRGDGEHVRGCWVVDLVLGKS